MGYYESMIILLPALILSLYANSKVKTNFAKYSRVQCRSGMTGYMAAQNILLSQGITNVSIERIRGELTDHYDPRTRTLRLSDPVYNSRSLSAVSVAAHECGHAVQHNIGYFPLKFRTAFVPLASFGSRLSMPFIFIGLLMGGYSSSVDASTSQAVMMVDIGILLYSFAVLFQVITLPVEFNASSRAIKIMLSTGIIDESESKGAKAVLSSAALTYIAATLSSLLSLLRIILVTNRNDD